MKISVLLPNYNHGRFIGEAIDAIRRQTHHDWELAIVDDGSTDDSRAVIEAATARDPRVTTRFLPANTGVNPALIACYGMTSGPLVLGAAADDRLADDHFFAKAVAAFAAHPAPGCVFGACTIVDEATGVALHDLGKAPHAGFIAPRTGLKAFFTGRLQMSGAGAVWRRDLVDKVGGYDPALGPQTDFFINHAALALGGGVFLGEAVAVVRTSPAKYSRSTSDAEHFRNFALTEQRLRALDLQFRIPPAWLRRWRRRVIDERLAFKWQHRFFAGTRKPLARLLDWHRARLPADFRATADALGPDVARWEADLSRRIAAAVAIFDAVAGPLPPSPRARLLRLAGRSPGPDAYW